MNCLHKPLFNYDDLRASVLVYLVIIIKIITFLTHEIKDGDYLFYIQNIGSIPNHNPLTFAILNFANFFIQNEPLTFAIVEMAFYVLLYSIVLISLNVVFDNEKYYYIAFFILMYLPETIFYGSPLKQVIGLVWFFILFSYFHKHKENIKHKLPLIFLLMFLAFLSHIVAFMFCLVLLGSYYLYTNKKAVIGITLFTVSFATTFSLFKDFFKQTFFRSFYKLETVSLINVNTIVDNVYRINLNPIYFVFILVYIIFVIGLVLYRKKINYIDVFVLIISTYFIFGACAGDYFFRFMSLIPFVLVFGLSSIVNKTYDRFKNVD